MLNTTTTRTASAPGGGWYDRNGTQIERTDYLVDKENLTGYSQVLAEIDQLAKRVKVCNVLTDQVAAQSEATGSAGETVTRYLHADGLGRFVSTERGAAADNRREAYDYQAFGAPLGGGDRSLTDYAFTGGVRTP